MRCLSNITMALFVVFACACGHASDVAARCVGVTDGDTITILTREHQEIRVRLAGIDAPEKAMPFGQRAKKELSDLVYGQDVRVRIQTLDRYGRTIGTVYVGQLDVCLEMVRRGMVWHYAAYAKTQPVSEVFAYAAAEREARASRLGLWVDANPTPPWDWRRAKREP